MDKPLIEELSEASHANEPAYVCFYNTGEVMEDEKMVEENMDSYSQGSFLRGLDYFFKDATQSYAKKYDFDSIALKLKVGLIYRKEDIDDENRVKENAEPLKGLVRCYTDDIVSFLDGEKSSGDKKYWYSRQGFCDYGKLVATVEENRLQFIGPKTFEEFKNLIQSGKNFDVSLFADIKAFEEEKEKKEQKKLRKIPFFRKKQ